MGSQKSFRKKLAREVKLGKKVLKKMTLKEARAITGPLELWGTSDPKDFYSNVQKELEDLFFQDRIKYTWNNLGRYAQGMYETPQDAIDVLVANTDKPFNPKEVKRFFLVKFIEEEMKKKQNKDKGPRTVVNENMKVCCILHGIPYDQVGPSRTEIKKDPKLKNKSSQYEHDQVVEQIIEKRRRVLSEKKTEYNRWVKEKYKYKAKEFNSYIQRKINIRS